MRGHRAIEALDGPSTPGRPFGGRLRAAAMVAALAIAACSPGSTNSGHSGQPAAVTSVADLGIPATAGPWTLTVAEVPVSTGDLIGEMIDKAGGDPADAVHAEVTAHGGGGDFKFHVLNVEGVPLDAFAKAAGESLFPRVGGVTSALGAWTITRYGAPRSDTAMWVAGWDTRIVIIYSDGRLTDAEAAELIGGL